MEFARVGSLIVASADVWCPLLAATARCTPWTRYRIKRRKAKCMAESGRQLTHPSPTSSYRSITMTPADLQQHGPVTNQHPCYPTTLPRLHDGVDKRDCELERREWMTIPPQRDSDLPDSRRQSYSHRSSTDIQHSVGRSAHTGAVGRG